MDVLINNAGVMRCSKSVTKEGIETHLGVNHMGHFLLTNLLLDCLKKSAPSRIVNVTMLKHGSSKINKEDLNSELSYNEEDAYNQSKLANLMFTIKLAEVLKGLCINYNYFFLVTYFIPTLYYVNKVFSCKRIIIIYC